MRAFHTLRSVSRRYPAFRSRSKSGYNYRVCSADLKDRRLGRLIQILGDNRAASTAAFRYMKLTNDDLSEEYKRGLEHLAVFLADREEWRSIIKASQLRGHKVDPKDHAEVLSKLAEFDQMIDDLEAFLAKEYERIHAEKVKEAEVTKLVGEATVLSQHLYLIIKHQIPHLLESFAEACLGPLDDDQREKFLDEVAILEATQLNAILTGKV